MRPIATRQPFFAFVSGPRWLAMLALLLTMTLAGCGGGSDSGNPPAPAPTGSVSGTVVSSANGQPVAGVAVRSGSLAATTDASGRYTLAGVPAAATALVTFDAAGYAGSMTRVTPVASATTAANVRLTPVASTATFNAAAGTTATVPNSAAQVTLPAGSLVVASTGAAATGNVTVQLTPIDPAADPGNMPGNYQSSTGSIESFGALDVTLRDAANNRLNLATGQSSTIRIPVSTRAGSLPATMPLYFLDDTTGLWVQQGTATLQGAAPAQYYEGTVTHFTVWNIDRPSETLFLTGCLVDDQNKPVANATVESNGINYSGKGSATTDPSGNFSVGMMRGTGVASIYATTSAGAFSNVIQAGPSNANINVPQCLKITNGNTPPQMVQQPADQAVSAGMPAYFTAQAVGSGTLAYQWKRNGSNIANATLSVLALNATTADDGARFAVTVTNAFGSVTSVEATLTVGAPAQPQIVTQPADQTVQVGTPATFAVAAAAFGQTLTYQWRRNGAPIAGATNASFSTGATVLGDDGALFSVVVSGSGGGTVTSRDARLTVSNATAPQITSQPQDVTVNAGQSAQFNVTATGVPAPTYQWSRNGAQISGATGATYSTAATTLADDGATFTVTVTNSSGSVTSNAARLTVTQPSGSGGYYHVIGAGPLTDASITYANGAQTLPSQALYGVREDAPGSAVPVDTTGSTGIVTFNAFEATIAGGNITNARSRIVSYVKDGRFWNVDQLVTSGAPTPQRVSTLTPADVCGSSGVPMLPFQVDGSDWTNAALGWIFLRAPTAGSCNSPDSYLAVRMNMADTTAPLSIGEPLAQIRGNDGSFAGLVVRNGNQVQRLDANLGSPANLFTVDTATFVNGGSVFGSAPPGLWIFVEGTSLYAVNLANPATRTPVATLAPGETLMSHFRGDGANAYVVLNGGNAGRVLRITSNLVASPVMTLDAPAADLALTNTRVAVSLREAGANPVRVVTALKTGSAMLPVFTGALGNDVLVTLNGSGENVYLTHFSPFSGAGPATIIVNADGTNAQTLPGTRILHGVGPEVMPLAQGLNQTYALIVVDGETALGLDAGARLRLIEGATRNALVTYGNFQATPDGQALMIAVAPMQYRQTAVVPYIGGSTVTGSDLYFIKSDVGGLTRVTTFLQ